MVQLRDDVDFSRANASTVPEAWRMVNWSLIGRATGLYTVGVGGGTSALALVTTRSETVMLLLVLAGLGCLGWASQSGAQSPRKMRSSDPTGRDVMGHGFDPDNVPGVKHHSNALKVLFVGVGLLVFGAAGMIVAGGF